jgi:uncharacterized NAD(P)/FAD-binding protein YdhS/flavin reductase (DIM6/NTAB) family NADH-FMN oxidoreductase RutF
MNKALTEELRVVMSHLPTGVTIVSTRAADGSPLGATVSAVTAISQEPPMLMVCFDHDSETLAGIHASGTFNVNFLAEHQRAISSRFAGRRGAAKVTGLELSGPEGEPPRLAEAIAHLTCEVDRSLEVGNREAVIAAVVGHRTTAPNALPLVYFRGHYSRLHEGDGPAGERPSGPPRLAVRERAGGDVPTVAIVGGGFAGAMTAVGLLRRRHPTGLRISLVERRAAVGRGLAYSTPLLAHRLNVPTGMMSALPDEPDHFLRWARHRDPSVGSESFVPRFLFGDYLEETLAQAEREAGPGVELERIAGGATEIATEDLPRRGVRVSLADGGEVRADWLVLATGNAPPIEPPGADPELLASDRYIGNPWDPDLLVGDEEDADPVILIGTGLTMIDVALTLGASSGRPTLHAVSRHGLLPRPHREYPGPQNVPEAPAVTSLAELVPEVLVEAAAAADRGDGWRTVVDSLRPMTNLLWARLDESERRWFIDHLSRVWEIHRHRMAPEVAMALDAMRRKGDLNVHAASVEGLALSGDGVELRLRLRGGGAEVRLSASRVVNCTGPAADVTRRRDPLVEGLLATGLARPEPLHLGLDVDGHGALLDSAGRASERIFTLGLLRKGSLWETTAVPELRCQAADLAAELSTRAAAFARPAPPSFKTQGGSS